jgi:MYXO-CTERM domain-containing protein
MRGARPRCALLTLLAALAVAGPAGATYSIVAVDRATRQVGGTGTSCVGGDNVYVIYGSAPGRGAVHAQAFFNQAARDRAVQLLTQGRPPADIIASITATSFDLHPEVRQYAVADLEGRAAGYTGSEAQSYAGDLKGTLASFTYSAQGNILTGEAVLTQAARAFESGGCDLAERLMRALEGGAVGGGGDSRCTPNGIPSDSAFVQVDREGEPRGAYLELQVPTSGGANPVVELRSQFDAWRVDHPCNAPVAGAGGGAGTGSAGGAALGGRAGDGTPGGGSASGGRTVGLPASASSPNDAGCGCRTGPDGAAGGAAVWGVLAFGLAVRRRWNRSAHRC